MDSMKKFLYKALITSLGVLTVIPANADIYLPSLKTGDCNATISDILLGISNRGAIIEYIQKKDATTEPGNPFPGSESLTIALNGSSNGTSDPKKAQQVAKNILMSDKLNYAWAKQTINACPHIAIVRFGMWQTGWLNSFYRFSDGQVRPRVCTRSIETSESWGFGWCD